MKKEKSVNSRSKRFFWLCFGAKCAGVFWGTLVFFYILTGSFLDSSFLKRDLTEKYAQVAGVTTTALSVKFVGLPNAPVLTAIPLCDDYASYVHLSWTTDDQMDYFVVSRDGSPLVSGITEAFYDDYAVDISTDYVYTVTAFNVAGQAVSDLVSVTSLDCGTPPVPDPTCEITRFDETNLAGFSGMPTTKNRSPIFYGTSNIPHAIIDVMVAGETSMLAITSANENGYWTWMPLNPFNYGGHTIWVTAIDPSDSVRRMTDSLQFKIKKNQSDDDEEEDDQKKSSATTIATPLIIRKPETKSPEADLLLKLSSVVKNPQKTAYPGKTLFVETKIVPVGDATGEENELHYVVVDERYGEIFRDSDKVIIAGSKLINKELSIPGLMKPGKYKLLVSLEYGGTIFTAEDDFYLKEVPLVDFGGGVTITTGQIMHNLFWVIFWGLLLLLVFLILLSIEYWMSQNAIIEITEEMLGKQGLIIKRKYYD